LKTPEHSAVWGVSEGRNRPVTMKLQPDENARGRAKER